jgi:hypothetical protein
MTLLTSTGMRETARRIRCASASQFVCIAARSVHVPSREGTEWLKQAAILKAELHALLKRDGFMIDGGWREQRSDEHSFTAFCDSKHKERVEWCEKIADELEAQGR